ncbi:MAG TPA: Fur family transcriptional regulator [Vicinamibacteria bacterium]|nr:Fur family transcriptional regulator [Vicinamibacteria bacterium]
MSATGENSTDRYLALCRERGLAMTVQRRVILDELVRRKDHPTADQIYDSVRDRLPEISRTTVYRVLDTFVKVGAIQKVLHPGAVARFDPIRERHHHLICERCGELFDLRAEAVPDVALPTLADGFLIEDYTINFSGICSGCRTC